MEGLSPYPGDELLARAGGHLDPVDIQEVFRFPYPAFAALVYSPLGALPFDLAAGVWAVLLALSLFVALWVVGVRDWRVFGVVAGSAPVIGAVRIGTATPVLVLLAALAWRWRDRRWAVALTLATAISLKLFLWPLVVWLAATRRLAAAIAAPVLAVLMTLGAWAVLRFEGLSDYPELLRRLTDVVQDRGFSLVALGVEIGASEDVAEVLPWLVGLCVLVAAVVVARGVDGDRRAFSLVLVAAIALTPIVWLHYFALLVVPLALARPRLSWPWLALWGFWLTPAQENQGDLWAIVVALAVTASIAGVTVLSSAWAPSRGGPAGDPKVAPTRTR